MGRRIGSDGRGPGHRCRSDPAAVGQRGRSGQWRLRGSEGHAIVIVAKIGGSENTGCAGAWEEVGSNRVSETEGGWMVELKLALVVVGARGQG